MNITIQALFSLRSTVLYIGELEGQITANQLKNPRFPERERGVERGGGAEDSKGRKKPRAGKQVWGAEARNSLKAPFSRFCCICWGKYAIIERMGNHSKQCKEFRSYTNGIMQI